LPRGGRNPTVETIPGLIECRWVQVAWQAASVKFQRQQTLLRPNPVCAQPVNSGIRALSGRAVRAMLVPLHRGFDGLILGIAQDWEMLGFDEQLNAAGDTRLSAD
jgi:hypothetical protein